MPKSERTGGTDTNMSRGPESKGRLKGFAKSLSRGGPGAYHVPQAGYELSLGSPALPECSKGNGTGGG